MNFVELANLVEWADLVGREEAILIQGRDVGSCSPVKVERVCWSVDSFHSMCSQFGSCLLHSPEAEQSPFLPDDHH